MGDEDVEIQSISTLQNFSVVSETLPFTLEAQCGNSLEVSVSLTPDDPGTFTEQRIIVTSEPSEVTVICSGSAREAQIQLDYDVNILDFGVLTDGGEPECRSLTIRNSSENDVEIINMRVVQDPTIDAAFMFDAGPFRGTIPFQSEQSVFLTFKPQLRARAN